MNGLPQYAPDYDGFEQPEVAELRSEPRFTPLIQPAKMVTEKGEFLCIVCDASTHGMKIRHLGNLPNQDSFAVELANGVRVSACVVWSDEQVAGLRFFEGIDRPDLSGLDQNGRQSRQIRLAINAEATLSWDHDKCQVLVENISRRGACVHAESPLPVDRPIRFQLADSPEQVAQVRWRKDSLHGLVFASALTIDQLALAVAAINRQG